MRLKIVLSLLLVVWITNVECFKINEEDVDDAAKQNFCYHDGYLSVDQTCVCKNDFVGGSCATRSCMNDGRSFPLSQPQGCTCPPGFLGTSCQPVKCVGGLSSSYYSTPPEQSLSLLITWNQDLIYKKEKQSDDPIAAVCDSFMLPSSSYASLNFQYGTQRSIFTRTKGNCTKFYSNEVNGKCVWGADYTFESCPGADYLTLDQILQTVSSSAPNSQVFIVTNTNLSTSNPTKENEIIRLAISNAITINVLSFTPDNIVLLDDYYESSAYTNLRRLAESTLGSFITPYHVYQSTLVATDNINSVITKLIDIKKNGFDTVLTAVPRQSILNILNIGKQMDYYVLIRTPTLDTTFSNKLNTAVFMDTGAWKMYKGTSGDTAITMIVNSPNATSYYLLATTTLSATLAVTTDDSVDASSPYALFGNVNSSLVVSTRPTKGYNNSDVTASTISPSLLLTPKASQRPTCQFNYGVGAVTCISVGPVIVNLRNKENIGSSRPFMCTDPGSLPVQSIHNILPWTYPHAMEEEETAPVCSDPGFLGGKFSESMHADRTFAIISRKFRIFNNTNSNKPADDSPLDNLYVRPKNIFEYMVKFVKDNQDAYSSYTANLVDNNPYNTMNSVNNFDDFISNVMGAIHDVTPSPPSFDGDIAWDIALKDTLSQIALNDKPFSDVIMVIDTQLAPGVMTYDIMQYIQSTRTKLFIILWGPAAIAPSTNATVSEYARLAAMSGGALIKAPQLSDIQDFFAMYYSTSQLNDAMFASDVVYHWIHPNSAPSLTTQSFSLSANKLDPDTDGTYWMSIYGTSPVMAVNLTSSNGTSHPQSPYRVFGETTLFKLGAVAADLYSIKIVRFQLPISSDISVIVWANNLFPITNVAFTRDKTIDVTNAQMNFGTTFPQYPVIYGSSANATNFSIKDRMGNMIQSAVPSDRLSCSFSQFVDFNWVCATPGTNYYLTTTSKEGIHQTLITRTQLVVCLSPDGEQACANGGQLTAGRCVCPSGYTGEKCENLICQNGGILTSGLKCDCSLTEGFTGDFCGIAPDDFSCLNDQGSPITRADLRNDIGSLIFVVDTSVSMPPLTTIPTQPGTQIVVVHYGCGSASLVLSSTDISLLPAALTYNECAPAPDNEDITMAMQLALDAQLTTRSLTVIISSTDFIISDRPSILNRLSARRAEIRMLTNNVNISPDMSFLALVGNGIPFVTGREKFNEYMTEYIFNLFSPMDQTKPPAATLSVVQSGSAGDVVSIMADETEPVTGTIIVHKRNTIVAVTPASLSPTCILTNTDSSTGICIYTTTSATGNIEIITTPAGNNAMYSVEKMTNVKTAYGFRETGHQEQLWEGLVYGSNTMSLYSQSMRIGNDVPSFPSINMAPILFASDTVSNAALYPTTHKPSKCIYPFYSIPIICDESVYGYQAQIITESSKGIQRKEQKILVCQHTTSSACLHGTVVNNKCSCNDGWTGMDCSQPICQAGSTQLLTSCICPPGSQGPTCDPVVSKRAVAFVLDLNGGDDALYNMSLTSISEYISMYSLTETLFFFTDSDGNANSAVFHDLSSYSDITKELSFFVSKRKKDDATPDLLKTFSTIESVVKATQASPLTSHLDLSTVYNYIFFLTQQGADLCDNTNLTTLKGQHFRFSSLALTSVWRQFSDENLQKLGQLGEAEAVNNWYDAVNMMRDWSEGSTYTVPPKPNNRKPSCVNGLQSNIFVAMEFSNVDNMDAYKEVMSAFLKLFPSDFELSPSFTPDPNTCVTGDNQFKGQSLFAGWIYRGPTFGGTPRFCPSNYNGLDHSLMTTKTTATQPSWVNLTDYTDYYLHRNCSCNRYDDNTTQKFVIWLPVTSSAGANNSLSQADTPWINYVIPFFDGLKNGDNSYYDILIQQNGQKMQGKGEQFNYDDFVIPWNAQTTIEGLVQELWTRLCRHAHIIDPEATAAPPVPLSQIDSGDEDDYWSMD